MWNDYINFFFRFQYFFFLPALFQVVATAMLLTLHRIQIQCELRCTSPLSPSLTLSLQCHFRKIFIDIPFPMMILITSIVIVVIIIATMIIITIIIIVIIIITIINPSSLWLPLNHTLCCQTSISLHLHHTFLWEKNGYLQAERTIFKYCHLSGIDY